jgi:hypothetical protein
VHLTYGEAMKKRSNSPALAVMALSIIVIAYITFLNIKKPFASNDNKSKLTLIETAKKIPLLKDLIAKNIEKQKELNEENNSSNDILTTERIYTGNEINEMSETSFFSLLTETTNRLPKMADIKKIPTEALHHTPEILIKAGRNLGVIKEVLKLHPAYENTALVFYQSCAKDSTVMTSARELCLTNLIEIKKKNKTALNLKDYPDQIVDLAKMVVDI